MYSFIIVSIGSNNRSFLRIHFSKIWTHGCIQTGSWKISAYGKMDRRGIVMSCRHLLEVYRLWRVSFQLDIWNCTPNGFLKFQCVSRGPVTTKTRSTKRVPIKGTQAGQISTRKKVTVPHSNSKLTRSLREAWVICVGPGIPESNQLAGDAMSTNAISLTISVLLKYLNVCKIQVWSQNLTCSLNLLLNCTFVFIHWR